MCECVCGVELCGEKSWFLQNPASQGVTADICPEKCMLRQFHRCATVTECEHINLMAQLTIPAGWRVQSLGTDLICVLFLTGK